MMHQRQLVPVFFAALAILGVGPGPGAQITPPEAEIPSPDIMPEGAPQIAAPSAPVAPDTPTETREEELEALFAELAAAEDDRWEPIQARIWTLWARSPSPSMTLLLSRANKAIEAEDFDTAMAFLDDLTRLAPDFAEGWNRRATLFFLQGEYGRSVADIQRTLALEPRHFGALTGLGIILERLERETDAYRAYERALEIHPNLNTAREGLERLAPTVEGIPL